MRYLAPSPQFVTMLAVALLLANCTNNASPTNNLAEAEQSGPTGGQSNSAAALASAPAGSEDYRISSRDIIDINVFQVPDLTKTVQVSDDGNVSLPLIGIVKLRNKTTHEAEEIIGDKLRKSYLRSPQVSVFVKQFGQRVTVSGEVKTPKVLAVDGRVTLTQAIANAGGFSDLADAKRVHIARTINGRIRDEVFDLDAIQAGKAADPPVQGGDLVVAEQSGVKVAFKNVRDLLPFAMLAPLM